MRWRRLAAVIVDDVRRHRRHLALASVGIVIGVASLVFFVSLGGAARKTLVAEVFPEDHLEFVPRTLDFDIWALRLGLGSDTVDEEEVARVRAVPGVDAVHPRMRLVVPTLASGGGGLLGADVTTEIVGDGIDPQLVAADVGAGYTFDDALRVQDNRGGDGVLPCRYDGDCPEEMYCSATLDGSALVCQPEIPVVVSNQMVSLYNSALRRAYGLPRLSPEAVIGLRFELRFGASTLRRWAGQGVRRRAVIVGFSDLATPLGVTMPISAVRRINAALAGPQAGASYHSLVVKVASGEVVPAVTRSMADLGFEVADRGARRTATAIALLTAVFAVLSTAIVAISAVSIMHVFLMLVHVRRGEIGIMRAVGASRLDIQVIIVGEAIVVGVLAGLIGVLVGAAAGAGAGIAADRHLGVVVFESGLAAWAPWWLPVGGIALAVVACVVGAAMPARRAALRDPADVLR